MLEIRKNTFSKNYENSFFREFSRHLYNSFKDRNILGVLIGSPLCEVDERLQIDALLITKNVVCIIDFKNFKGKIKLPNENNFEFGIWTTETGDQVKGGSTLNPFIQLKNQKRRFIDVSNKHIEKKIESTNAFNPFHSVRIICFQEEVEISGNIPSKESLNFFILDKRNFIEKILDIIDVTDKEVSLTEKSFDVFKSIFRADLYKFDERPFEDKLKEVASQSTKLDYNKLYDDQKAALSEIKLFLENSEQQVFVLQGTINSGKSYLIPFIQELAYNSQIQETEIFAVSSRVAKNLLSSSRLEKVNSIYSFIYGGLKSETEENTQEENQTENEEQEISDELPMEVVPMKKSDNSENALFIVDESQLVSDSYHQSIDLVFGSGYLLKDFIKFTDFNSSKRKIVFIGDPYQLQLGRTDESPLNPAYLEESYNLKVSSFQLLDKPDFSEINQEGLNCAQSIKNKLFNSLRFNTGNQISILTNEDKLPCITNLITKSTDGHILSFSNEESQKVNLWIKKSIIKTGEDIATKDLVLFNNNISVEDENDPFSEPKKIYNGQFAIVLDVSQNIISETIKIKQEQTTISLRELSLRLTEAGHQVKVLSLENYRLNPKAELSKNEIIAFKVILNAQISRYIKENPFEKSSEYKELVSSNVYQAIQKEIDELKQKFESGEKVKGKLEEKEIEQRKLLRKAKRKHRLKIENSLRKDPATKYHKYKNAALLRFGWAMTVHKSMSYKWNEVFFNIETGGGKNNENYFRWLYTGISRAKQKVNLINFKPISPFDNIEFKDTNSGVKSKDIFFYSDNNDDSERIKELTQFLEGKFSNQSNSITNVDTTVAWQVRYSIKNENTKQECLIYLSYAKKGNFKIPANPTLGGDKTFSNEIIETLKRKSELQNFEIVKHIWRKREYEKLKNALSVFKIKFELLLQTSWKDKIRFFSDESELEIELDYGGDGMVSYITAKYYSDETIWENFKNSVESLK
jgi:hypothetical protein